MVLRDAGWDNAKNILCVRLDTIGDVLMTSPAFRALKEGHPERNITLMTSSRGAEAAALIPEVDDVIVYDSPWMKATPERPNSSYDKEIIDCLRKRKFDAAVIFTVFSQNPWASAFLCYLAGIPLRLAQSRENPYQLLTHWLKDTETAHTARHEVRRQLDLVESVGGVTADERILVQVPKEALQAMRHRLNRRGLDFERPWVVIHPGASAPSRRYRPEGFAAIAARLIEDGFQIVFSGDRSERSLIKQIQEMIGAPTHSLAGYLSLIDLAALLKLAPMLISNNTGPVHVAAGVGAPVVDIYALTNPQHTPWGVPSRVIFHDVPCKNCLKSVCPLGHHNCLRLVKPSEVVKAVYSLLDETMSVPAETAVEAAENLELAA